ncbi:klhl40b [Symbiodinium natans]|uniref:Klhl40b protein n=1 Tax=Symbiodinium natans TaxID=878477 RepID=A0A812I7C7_9DINO|nr:klhl40b [Symbiodinium natans]
MPEEAYDRAPGKAEGVQDQADPENHESHDGRDDGHEDEEEMEEEESVEPEHADGPDHTDGPEGDRWDDGPALRAALRALARQLKILHASSDVSLKAGGALFKCRRDVVATWSSPFKALMQSHAMTGQEEGAIHPVVEVDDVAPEILETAIRFMLEGCITFQVRPLDETHELLHFADAWDLDDLKATYGEMMMSRARISTKNAAPYLKLGLRFSVANIARAAADTLAQSVDVKGRGGQVLPAELMELDAACMQAILASEALHVEDEADALELIKRWAGVDTQRAHDVPELLTQVRLSLCGFQTLIDLVSNLSKEPWQEVDAKRLNAKVRRVVDEKLQAITSDRLRQFTKLPDSENEHKLATTLQASKTLYEV